MSDNPYAPPQSSVEDLGADDREVPRRSTILVMIGANAALVGFFWLLGGLFSTISRSEQGRPIGATMMLGLWGAIAIAAAIDIFRRRRWAVIAWCVLTALFLVVVLLFGSFERPIGFVIAGFLAAQFIGSLLGVWVMLIKSKRPKVIAPGIA